MKNFLKNILPLLVINIVLLPLLISHVNSLYSIALPYWGVFAILMNLAFLKGKMVKVIRVLFVPLVVNFIVYMFLYFYNMLEIISFTFVDLYKLKIGIVNTALVSNLIMIFTGILINRKKKIEGDINRKKEKEGEENKSYYWKVKEKRKVKEKDKEKTCYMVPVFIGFIGLLLIFHYCRCLHIF